MTTPYVSPSDKYRMEPGKTYCRVEIVIDDGYFAHVTYYDQAGSRTEEESLSDDGSSLIARLKDEGWQEVHVSHIQGVGQTHFFERQHASEAGKVVFPKKSASTVVNPYDRARMDEIGRAHV